MTKTPYLQIILTPDWFQTPDEPNDFPTIQNGMKESNQKKHHLIPEPIDELNGNLSRLCQLLEILLDTEAKQIKIERKLKEEEEELERITQKILDSW